jgi:hypothetical protein
VRLQERIDFKEHEFKDIISNLEKDEDMNQSKGGWMDLAEQMRNVDSQ